MSTPAGRSVNPRTGQVFGPEFPDTSMDALQELIAKARGAARTWGGDETLRIRALRSIADALDARGGELAELADAETGLGMARLVGEVERTSFQLRMFADLLEAGGGREDILDPAVAGDPPVGHPDLRRTLLPIGPVAVFGASNFPFAFSALGGDTASALAAGCPVVAKAHPSHPQTSRAVIETASTALSAAGAPPGVLGLVYGLEAGIALIAHADIKAAAFTGSGPGGRALFDLACARPDPIPFYGELGSVNPVVVSPRAAERESLVSDYLGSLCLGSGQFCTNPGLLLAPIGLVESLEAAIADAPAGTLLNAQVAALLHRHVDELSELPGVRVLASAAPLADGFSARPMLLVADAASAPEALLTTECFGPVGVVVTYESTTQLLAVLSRLDGALVAAVHATPEEELVHPVLEALSGLVGRIVWNGWPTGVAVTAGQHHGGPYPASTNPLHTSVGTTAIRRFQRPITYQSFPVELLPEHLR